MAVRWRYIGDQMAAPGRGLSSLVSSGVVDGASAVLDRQGRSCGGWWQPREPMLQTGWLLRAPTPALGALLMPLLIPRPLVTQEAFCWVTVENPDSVDVKILPTAYVDGGTAVGETLTVPGGQMRTALVRAYVTGLRDGGRGRWAVAGIGWSTVDPEEIEIEPSPSPPNPIRVSAGEGTIRCDDIEMGTEVILPGGERLYVGSAAADAPEVVGYCFPYPTQDVVSSVSLAAFALPPIRLLGWHVSMVGQGRSLTVPDARSSRPATVESAAAVRDATLAAFEATSTWSHGMILADTATGTIPLADGTPAEVARTILFGSTRTTLATVGALVLPWADCTVDLRLDTVSDSHAQETVVRGEGPRSHPFLRALAGGAGAWGGGAAALVGPNIDTMRAYQIAQVAGDITTPQDEPLVDISAEATPAIDAPGGPRLAALVAACSVLEVRR